ncbi:MAG TPA: 23S rRNA (uracil(1939)-C(5))-methyltransferase RlmD [Steroidobacteraceae bacterium]|nr:23S rRNA (uracil(1939)-C(5))-methyltransferase RlmD [Steroidobacteraceae bacterium]
MNRPATHEPPETGVVAALNHEGAGIVHGGKTVFVPGALPRERIRFRRTKRHRQHDDAELIEVLEPSPDRVEPRCAHFGVCGGCALQHLSPSAQIAAKQDELRDALERIGRVRPAEWLAPLQGPAWEYRRRARLGSRYVAKKGRALVGFRERFSAYVAALQRCEILAPPVGALPGALSELLTTLAIRERVPQIEVAVGEEGAALVLRALQPPTADDAARLRAFGKAHGVRWFIQEGGIGSIRPLDPSEPGESDDLAYHLPQFDLSLRFSPADFVQVNPAINRALVALAVELLRPTRDARVLDLFCGLGNFTLPLARVAAHATGVEGEAALIERARANARANGIGNASFHTADLSVAPGPGTAWMRERYTHVLLDPPRAGALPVLPAIAELAPERVLYVSCHPGSLARDLAVLVHEHGLRLQAAGVIDMFPHTTHVESVAMLERSP